MMTTKKDYNSNNTRDLRATIASLQKSTSTAETYAKVIEKYLSSRTGNTDVGRSLDSQRQRNTSSTTVSESRDAIINQQRQTNILMQRSIRDVIKGTSDIISQHDGTLSSLEGKQGTSSQVPKLEDHIRRLLGALEKTRADILTTRLARSYLHAKADFDLDSDAANEQAKEWQCDAVKEDLNLLYDEIPGICHMLVNHQHQTRLHAVLDELHDSQELLQRETCRLTYSNITKMTARMNDAADMAETLQSHRQLLQHVDDHLRSVNLSDDSKTIPSEPPKSTVRSPTVLALHQYLEHEPASDNAHSIAASSMNNIEAIVRDSITTNGRHRSNLSRRSVPSEDHNLLLGEIDELVVEATARLNQAMMPSTLSTESQRS